MTQYKFLRRRRWLPAVFACLIVAGCAGYASHRDGMALLEQGKYEDAVTQLGLANRQAPGNLEYRKDYVRAREQVVSRLIALGNSERIAERFDAADVAYRRVLTIVPDDSRAKVGLEAVLMERRHAAGVEEARAQAKKGNIDAANVLLKMVFLENQNHGKALQLQREINEGEAKRLAAAPTLKSSFKKPVTLQFRDANLRMVFEAISRSSGINILLDKDVRADLKVSVFVKDVSVEDTIDVILLQNQLEKKVLSDNTIFVYPNLPAKTKEYQELKVRSFHLVHADAKQMLTLIKTMLKTKDIVIHEKTNSLVMRDTPEAIRLAEKMVADQDIAEPEVMLEVEVMEITHTLLSELGIRYPDQVTLTPTAPGGGAVTLGNLTSSAARNQLLVTPVPTITLNAHLDRGEANILASPRIRTRNHEKAKIHIGDRLPVFTNSVTPLATGASVTTGTVQYLEVGIKLEAEPSIYSNGEVAIKISLEVSSAGSPVTNAISGTTAYPIATRTASTVLRLKDGETQVLAGLIRDDETRAKVMIPGLGELPILGRLFSTLHTSKTKTEVVLSITPRLMGTTTLPNAQLVEFWSGTEGTLRSEPTLLRPSGTITMASTGGAPAQPLPPGRTAVQPQPAPPAVAAPKPALALAAPGGQPRAGGPAASFTWQGPAQAKVGDRFSLTLNGNSPEAVRKIGLVVTYNPALLRAVESVEGGFAKQGGSAAAFTRDINQSGGQIAVDVTNGDEQGARGSGSLTTITFEAAAAGPIQIGVASVSVVGVTGEAINFIAPATHNMTLAP